ncbi:MAG: ABC transporter [Acidobacteria bacterium]|nr:MAG: ABC transporter [Acidobacteriota bacterium]
MTSPLIELKNVGLYYKMGHLFYSKRRAVFWALKDVSLSLYKGETLGILGRNGAGKSTLLKVIGGILAPDFGVVHRKTHSISLLSLQLGFVTHLTGRENIIMSGLLLGCTRETLNRLMDKIIEFAELGSFIDQPIHTYSTGMKARLGFSVAFHTNPEVILIDETLGVGDVEFRKKSTARMKERIKSNKTVVLVSHNTNVIRELCDRAVWIDDGKTLLEGKTETVLESYSQSCGKS